MTFLRSLFQPLRFDWKIVVITVVTTTVILIDTYPAIITPIEYQQPVLFFLVPMLFILVVFRESPGNYGFTLGDWRAGLWITLGGIVVMTPIIWLVGSQSASMQAYYLEMVAGLPWNTFLALIGWEFMLRGWILFGYARKFGPDALWLQAVPFAFGHIGKPAIETLTTVLGGFVFGWIAYRTRSFLYPFLIHWYISTLVVLVVAGTLD
jgi:membrane protease YdiL (CAAX protease family)